MTFINENWDTLLAILGGLYVVARGIVAITPSKTDNEIVEKVIGFITVLTGLKRKS